MPSSYFLPRRVATKLDLTTQTFTFTGHAHHAQHVHSCVLGNVATMMQLANIRCKAQNIKLTTLRYHVLEIIYSAKKPIGAYDILAALSLVEARKTAPPTVYRTLDFLLQHGFIHRLASLNAFIPCCHPRDSHEAVFYICSQCGFVQEGSTALLSPVLMSQMQQHHFKPTQLLLEVTGLCATCQNNPKPAGT